MLSSFKGQRAGVYLMAATEFWERFSYYGFMGIVVLFMIAPSAQGGLAYDRPAALLLFGIVTSFIWIMPIFGGWLSDRLIGPRLAVLGGCAGLSIGNFLLAGASWAASADKIGLSHTLFASGIVGMIAGAGLFKSNASALLGTLFRQGDARREAGFILFYMGINMGALIAPFGAGTLGQSVGWAWGFGAAAIGMAFGMVVFAWKARAYFPEAGPLGRDSVRHETGASLRNDRNVHLILLMAAFTVIYMTGQMTYGGIMNLYALDRIERSVAGFTIPSTWFLSLNPLLVVLLGESAAAFWQRRSRRTHRVLFVEKIATGLFLMAASFVVMMFAEASGSSLKSPLLLIAFYVLITAAELCVLPAGLVEISRRAPRGATGVLMGVWILTMGLGSFLAGYLGSLTGTMPLVMVFGLLTFGGLAGAAVLMAMERRIRGHMGELANVD